MVLAPETPEKNPNSYGASGGFDAYQRSPITKVYESDSSVELEADLRGTKMVVGFGDNNCQIKHYHDFEADFDDFQKIISNCKFYLDMHMLFHGFCSNVLRNYVFNFHVFFRS